MNDKERMESTRRLDFATVCAGVGLVAITAYETVMGPDQFLETMGDLTTWVTGGLGILALLSRRND